MELKTQKEETSVEYFFNNNARQGTHPRRYTKVVTDDDPVAVDIENLSRQFLVRDSFPLQHHMLISLNRFLIGYSFLLVACITKDDPEPTYRLFEIDLGGIPENKNRVSDKFTIYDLLALDVIGGNFLTDSSIDYVLRRFGYSANERLKLYDSRASALNQIAEIYSWKRESSTSDSSY